MNALPGLANRDDSGNRDASGAPAPPGGPFWLPAALLCALTVMFGCFLLREHLDATEARFLNSLLEESQAPAPLQQVHLAWSRLCGFMERPGRLLSLLLVLGGLILVVSTLRRAGHKPLRGLLAALSFYPLLAAGTTIGSGAWLFFVLSAAFALLSPCLSWSPGAWGHVMLLALMGFTVLSGSTGAPPPVWQDLLELGPEHGFLAISAVAATAVWSLMALLVLTWMKSYRGLLLFVLVLCTPAFLHKLGLPTIRLGEILPAMALPLALHTCDSSQGETKRPLVTLLLLVNLLVSWTIFGGSQSITANSESARQKLDWVAHNLQDATWLVLDGPERHILRYYEHVGHRTGHRSILMRSAGDWEALRRQAAIQKPPTICLVGSRTEDVASLSGRYVPVPSGTVPKGIVVLNYRRKE